MFVVTTRRTPLSMRTVRVQTVTLASGLASAVGERVTASVDG